MFIPAGTYTIRGTLNVPSNVVLRGSNEYPFRSWGLPEGPPVGTTLLAYAGQGNHTSAPFIMLHTNSGVRGFNVFYPAQN